MDSQPIQAVAAALWPDLVDAGADSFFGADVPLLDSDELEPEPELDPEPSDFAALPLPFAEEDARLSVR